MSCFFILHLPHFLEASGHDSVMAEVLGVILSFSGLTCTRQVRFRIGSKELERWGIKSRPRFDLFRLLMAELWKFPFLERGPCGAGLGGDFGRFSGVTRALSGLCVRFPTPTTFIIYKFLRLNSF